MSAFGRMLIQYWGGNLKTYDNDDRPHNTPVSKKTKCSHTSQHSHLYECEYCGLKLKKKRYVETI